MTGHFTAPLSAQQQGVWVTMSLDPDDPALIVRTGFPLPEESRNRLVVAARHLAERHEVLRTTFGEESDGASVQVIHPAGMFEPTILDAEDLHSLDPLVQPPWQLRLTADGVVIEAHHLVADARSCQIWSDELTRWCLDPNAASPRLDLQYADYACSQQEWRAMPALRSRIKERAELFAVDRPTPAPPQLSFNRLDARQVVRAELSATSAVELARLARANGVSELSTWVAAASVAFTAQGRGPALGVLHDGRHDPAWAGVTGCFADITVVACDGVVDLDRPAWSQADRREGLRRAHAALSSALEAVDLPFADLMAVVHEVRQSGGTDLRRFGIRVDGASEAAEAPSSVRSAPPTAVDQDRSTPFDVQLTVRPGGPGRSTVLELSFPHRWRSDIAQAVLGRVVDAAERLSGRSVNPQRVERIDRVIRTWADRAPASTAVTGDQGSLTYGQLIAAADRLGRKIDAHPLSPRRRVGVLASRGPTAPVAILGIWAAEATYVPLDPHSPPVRLRDTAAAAALDLVLFDSGTETTALACFGDAVPVLGLADILDGAVPARGARLREAAPAVSSAPHRPAYLMFTSGSTGRPKGVAVGHAALAAVVSAMTATIGADPTVGWLALTPYTFDIAMLELLLPLAVGGRVVIATEDQVTDPGALSRLCRQFDVTVVQATPAGWRAILTSAARLSEPPPIILCGGEALPYDLGRRLVEASRSAWNVYGPTEATIWAAAEPLSDALRPLASADTGSVPIGRGLPSAVLAVWDDSGAPVPPGREGELVISGPCLADGYVDDPLKTVTQFVRAAGRRWYRTGDMVRELADGRIAYIGRTDQQVKVRGHRIELGDLEAALRQVPGVADAAADAHPDSSGENRLAALVVPASDFELEPAAIRLALAELLPGYLLPSFIRIEPAVPLTAHGKVDRTTLRRLLAADVAAPDPNTGSREADLIEDRLTSEVLRHCRALLGGPEVGVDDDFFAIGGHSLLMVQLLAVLRAELAPTLSLRELFDRPVIRDIAASVALARATHPDVPQAQRPVLRRLPR